MKLLKSVPAFLVVCITQLYATAQPDTAKISANAILFADSLIKADRFESWNVYADLAPASVIKHYGGREGYIDYVQKARTHFISSLTEEDPTTKMQTLMAGDNQWQCVIRASRYIHRDNKKYHIITYFIGQSTDDGQTWRLFDAGYNRVANIIFMMPDILGDLPIQEHTILSEEEELAAAQAAQAKTSAKISAKPSSRKTSPGK